ncbi:tRNA (guanosine(37)-N1)-methyltransferase TrmD [Paucilactobacillus suebicus]|uniref:tRNA (guanine-N(1)-)-methyltransferase n=1 Tax=Paucilactobacillus suebicus DSM 5007 = KCTC 3549 TaxID=1423807 RepID=A0A0R1W5L0_9LACO|nr:tRNA (guanosine(37)-N1)-methyltransferase TrmD [Paucilactobacillus suebicus]KRM13105.1 tRNA (guanine-N(1)-)-methyltransferase [Paucilactobacillus suebicus DSM 5007 = KCTC 3549]
MRIDILSLFPEMFKGPLTESILGKATEKGLLDVNVTDFREYTTDKQRHVDDAPYGGGAGMLLQAQPIFDAFDAINKETDPEMPKGRVILLDPAGKRFDQRLANDLAQEEHLTFICGHYEGYDERIRNLVTDEVSLGDFVLTGGELAAMVMIDATVRFIPGVLGNHDSASGDSFSNGLLEYPQYTRPADFRGMKVPDVLLSGNHQLIRQWRSKESLRRTLHRRPDLLDKIKLTAEQRHLLSDIKIEEDDTEPE